MRVKNILFLCSVAALPQLALALPTGEARGESAERPATEHSAVTNPKSAASNKGSSTAKTADSGQNSGPVSGGLGSPQALGMVHGILDFCSQIDPADAATFQQQWATTVAGAASTQLVSIEGGGDYKQGYNYVIGLLEKLPRQELIRGCAGGAGEWKGKGSDNEGSGKEHRTTTGQTIRPKRD